MANPLNAFVSSQTAGGFKLSPLPKLDKLVSDLGFHGGMIRFDEEMERWKTDLERQVNERLQKKAEPEASPITSASQP